MLSLGSYGSERKAEQSLTMAGRQRRDEESTVLFSLWHLFAIENSYFFFCNLERGQKRRTNVTPRK